MTNTDHFPLAKFPIMNSCATGTKGCAGQPGDSTSLWQRLSFPVVPSGVDDSSPNNELKDDETFYLYGAACHAMPAPGASHAARLHCSSYSCEYRYYATLLLRKISFCGLRSSVYVVQDDS